ncbi:MAG: hypothetical protein M1608_11990 [Candidatus Omnitrophica bacterium]|nr:hypothetical protein [Candidatus Omnitrophota bacterium]
MLAIAAGFLFTICGCASRYRIAWGDTHGHTSLSNGQGSVDDYLRRARDEANLDILIVTDHDFGHEAPWRMPAADWDLTQAKVDEYTVDGRFVAISGYEWTSQEKYWTEVKTNLVSDRLFPGPPCFYNHKVVYFPAPVAYLFSAKDPAYKSPDLLAEAVRRAGGLIQNAHPDSTVKGLNQFDYAPSASDVIVNTEMSPDVVYDRATNHPIRVEQTVRAFLDHGGRTGFVAGTDTHEGKPAARTAVLATKLTRAAIFDALRHRRNYAVNNNRDARMTNQTGSPEADCCGSKYPDQPGGLEGREGQSPCAPG